MDEYLHERWQQLKTFTERLETIIGGHPSPISHLDMLVDLDSLFFDMRSATDAAKEEHDSF